MADDDKKKGLNAPIVNPHAGDAKWANILASAAAGMAGQPNPYMAQLQQQQAAQAQALQNAKAAQAAQLANYANTAQAHQQDPAVQQAAIAAAHPGPAAGGLAGNPLAQAPGVVSPDEMARRQAMMAGNAGPVAMSDERLKENIDRNVSRQMRVFLDSLETPQPARRAPYNEDSLAGRALRRG